MNDNKQPASSSTTATPTGYNRVLASATAKMPDSVKTAPAAVGLMNQAVHGAHNAIDHLADGAAPTVQHLVESVSTVSDALHARADQLSETRDEWVNGARTTVRNNPLTSIASAFALSALLARITR